MAVATATAPVRCAIYTRKSTDEGLDRDFSSLDNQRERAEAYAASQGWAPVATRYDDGGFSGGTTERPALKRLLADVDVGLVDAIIVYRLDRLSRSLADFVNIHRFLEQQGVALVSVTESINTSTSHGRMIVNVLVSFGQYERELASDRTKHKIEGARRRGKWTGGTPRLGYDTAPEGGRLLVNKDEAEQVRAIFALYSETPSLVRVAQELNRRGGTTKGWTTRQGKAKCGQSWNKATLRNLLADPLYIGMQKLGDETFPGEHDAIVPKALFQKVQRLLAGNRSNRGASGRNQYGALLRGILHCAACGTAMAHAPVKKDGRLYRYYRCLSSMRNGATSCPSRSISADRVESFVVDRIRCIGRDPALREETFRQAMVQVAAQRRGLKAERKRLERDLAAASADVERLVGAVSRVTGPAADAIATELTRAQERLGALEARIREVRAHEAALAAQEINEADLARALEAFDPIWEVLLTPEKERLLRLIVERVTYDGATKQLQITFHPTGIATLAADLASAESSS